MTRTLNIGASTKTILKYTLAALICWFLISRGLHPVWAILAIIYRKAVLRICLILAAIYWLTSSIM